MSIRAYVNVVPVEREVTIAGAVDTVFLLPLTSSDWQKYLKGMSATDDPDARAGAQAFLVHKGFCEADGTPSVSLDQAAGMDESILQELERHWLRWRKEKQADLGNVSGPVATNGSGTTSQAH